MTTLLSKILLEKHKSFPTGTMTLLRTGQVCSGSALYVINLDNTD